MFFYFGRLKITISTVSFFCCPPGDLNLLMKAVIHKQWQTSPYQCLLVLGELGCSCCLFPTGRTSLLPRHKPAPRPSAPECGRNRRQPAQKGAQSAVNAKNRRRRRVKRLLQDKSCTWTTLTPCRAAILHGVCWLPLFPRPSCPLQL